MRVETWWENEVGGLGWETEFDEAGVQIGQGNDHDVPWSWKGRHDER